jgi:hypothetical protein
MLHKIQTGQAAIPAHKFLHPVTRQSRHTHNLAYQRPSSKKNCHSHSFFPQTIKDWNNLPTNIVNIQDNDKFKQEAAIYLRKATNPIAAHN